MKTPEQIINLHPYPSILDDIIYCSWDVECDRLKLVIMGHILPFYATPPPKKKKTQKNQNFEKMKKKTAKKMTLDPPNNSKNENFEKMRKTPGDITTSHLCTTNDNHMMYGFLDIKCNTQNFFSFWTILYPVTPLTTQKIKILKKWEIALEISSFYTSVP